MSKRVKTEPVERPQWEVGTVLDGKYHIGNWIRTECYQVVEHKTGKPPVLVALKMETVSEVSDPSQTLAMIQLKLPVEQARGETFKARWQPSREAWAITYKDRCNREIKVYLEDIHVDGKQYTENSYG